MQHTALQVQQGLLRTSGDRRLTRRALLRSNRPMETSTTVAAAKTKDAAPAKVRSMPYVGQMLAAVQQARLCPGLSE